MTIERDKRVLFVRPGPMGNTLAAVPALRAIKLAWPQARVVALVERPGREALGGCPYIDEFILYEKRGAQKGTLGWLKTVIELRKREFTHVILSKRFFRMSFMASFTGAPVRVGFADYGYGLTVAVNWLADRPAIDTNLDLVAAIGVPSAGRELEIWPSEDDRNAAMEFLRKAGLDPHPLNVAIHAGGVSQKRIGWPVERYAQIAVELEKRYGAAPVFIGAPSERGIMDEISAAAGKRYPFTAEAALNVRADAHLIGQCKFLIGADSAPAHLASAVKTPGIIYYGPQPDWETNVRRWKPEGDLYIAAGPQKDGSHAEIRTMLGHVSELIHRMKAAGRW